MKLRARYLVIAIAFACPSKKPAETQRPESGSPRDDARGTVVTPARPVDSAATGNVSGKVAFRGEAPKAATIDMRSNAACAAMHPGGVTEEPAVAADGAVRDAFVWVKSKFKDVVFTLDAATAVLDQSGCRYRPRVIGIMVGQPLEIRNSDSTSHNVNGAAKVNEPFNVGMSMRGVKETKRFKREEVMMKVGCDIHPWMAAYVGVVDHPFFAVTGADGAFSLPGVPAGEHVVGVWHEKFGTREAKVTVAAKGDHKLAFEFGN